MSRNVSEAIHHSVGLDSVHWLLWQVCEDVPCFDDCVEWTTCELNETGVECHELHGGVSSLFGPNLASSHVLCNHVIVRALRFDDVHRIGDGSEVVELAESVGGAEDHVQRKFGFGRSVQCC